MNGTKSETRLIWPGLQGFYDTFFDVAFTLMRVAIGYILLRHGLVKMHVGAATVAASMAKSGLQPAIAFAYAAMALETVGAACIILGLFTRVVAFICSGEMAVAYFLFHGPRGFWPVNNHGETPVLLCFIFLYLSAAGAGAFSLDAVLRRKPTG
jgi:putative oxidoreductase